MLPETLDTPMARHRFLREARACARLKSDHVVRVFDVGELDDGTPYMVLEYLEGVDLETHMADGRPLPLHDVALYVLQMCAALAEAHGLGIVHRDLKPANVFLAQLPDGTTRVKLLDFGISKVLDDRDGTDQTQTQEGTVMGTPHFMSPEQVRGDPVDARTDIWAVGVVLYYISTGQLPFDDEVPLKTLDQVLTRDPLPPTQHVPGMPLEVAQIILRCLQKDADDRPSSVDEIADAIAPFADEEGLPISRKVRRIRESSADVRASLSSMPTLDSIRVEPTFRPMETLATPATLAPSASRSRWMRRIALTALVALATVVTLVLRTRAPRSSSLSAVAPAAAPLSIPPVAPPAASALPAATPRATEVAPPTAQPAPHLPESAAPPFRHVPASASVGETRGSPTQPAPRSGGFDLGSRF
jgi:serine/threonine-protein kinase